MNNECSYEYMCMNARVCMYVRACTCLCVCVWSWIEYAKIPRININYQGENYAIKTTTVKRNFIGNKFYCL